MDNFRDRLKRMRHSELAWGVCTGILLGLGLAILAMIGAQSGRSAESWSQAASTVFAALVAPSPRHPYADATFAGATEDVRRVISWIDESRDAQGLPFVIVDKKDARVYVLDKDARLRGVSPVLLGSAVGDDTVPGIGTRAIEEVRPEERTTPAGRFVGERGHNARGEDVIWVDYDAAVSMHRVLTTNNAERRLERIASADKHDKRISYGCINVPAEFFESRLRPIFSGARAIIYVLPEVKAIDAVFNLRKVAATNANARAVSPGPWPRHPADIALVPRGNLAQ
jgi:hypothetical protein